MTPDELKTWVEIVQGTVTTVGILAAGIWSFFTFVLGRSFAPNIQIRFELKGIVDVAQRKSALVTVKIKNIGRTRVRKKRCCIAASPIGHEDHISRMPDLSRLDKSLDFGVSRMYDIFDNHSWFEPDEEEMEDVLLALGESHTFKVAVIFSSRGHKSWMSSVIWEVRATEE